MKKSTNFFLLSLQEFKHIRVLTAVAMLVALAMLLSMLTIDLSASIRVMEFTFLPKEMSGMLFGPVVGGIMGGLTDVVAYAVHPSGFFFPGYMLSNILIGLIYGCFLYKRPLSVSRVICAQACVTVFVNILLNTFWSYCMYGAGTLAEAPVRVLIKVLVFPVEVLLFYLVAMALKKSGVLRLLRQK